MISPDERLLLQGSVCAIGVFDGFHRGHRHLIDLAAEEADSNGADLVVITFDKDPDEVFRGKSHVKIMDNEQRIQSLLNSGADVLVLPFDDHLRRMGPDEFLDSLFGGNLPASIFVGEDFRFGNSASGDFSTLARWAASHSVKSVPVPLLEDDGTAVTSSRIRSLLRQGNIVEANSLLGHPYRISGVVEHGAGKGAGLGFQTANMKIPPQLSLLDDGVYAGTATIGGIEHPAAMSVGISPTFAGERDANLEVHVLDFDGDLYGSKLEVSVLERLRPLIRFDDTEALVETVKGDIGRTREIFSERA